METVSAYRNRYARPLTMMLGLTGLLLLLACINLDGLLLALIDSLLLSLREGAVVTLIGLAIGLPAAFLAARALRALMFGVSEAAPLTFIATAGFFLAMGLGAGILPARRAAGVDPVAAFRTE